MDLSKVESKSKRIPHVKSTVLKLPKITLSNAAQESKKSITEVAKISVEKLPPIR